MGFSRVAGVEDDDWCSRVHGSDASVSGLIIAQDILRKTDWGKRVFVVDVASLELSGITDTEAGPLPCATPLSTEDGVVDLTSLIPSSAGRI